MDSVDPRDTMPYTESVEPILENARIDIELPKYTVSFKVRLEPK